MRKIRFYYRAGNLEDGEKYLKPAREHPYPVISAAFDDYRKCLRDVGMEEMLKRPAHPGRCPVLHKTNNTGWISFINKNLDTSEILDLPDTFKNYPNGEGYVVNKVGTGWEVSIPKDYYLISLPTLYHTKDWFSLPGVIDPANFPRYQKSVQLNAFIIRKEDQVIPDNSPICQWILAKKEEVEVEYGVMTEEELLDVYNKDYMTLLKLNNIDRYKELKNSGLFSDGD